MGVISDLDLEVVMTFSEWMREVDGWLESLCGMSSADLPGVGYRDAYDDRIDPSEFASQVFEGEFGMF